MVAKFTSVLTAAFFLSACAAGAPGQAPSHDARSQRQPPAADAHMTVIEGQDISAQVFKRLGLPNQNYCWQQCLQEDRCAGTRWGFIAGATAGQCQLLTGELALSEPREIKTADGQQIIVIASRKTASDPDPE